VNRPLVVNPLAEEDLALASAWYDERKPGLGDDFLDRVEEAFELIRRSPELHRKEFLDLRLVMTRRFPYAVIYRVDETQITVVAVYHTHRDPRGWQTRY
jgi:plasmid stabilization system protein ParE